MTEPTDAGRPPQPGSPQPQPPLQPTGEQPAFPSQPGQAYPVPSPQAAAQPPSGRWKGLVAALAVGLLVGGGIGAGTVAALSDPTDSDEYQALAAELDDARAQDVTAEQEAATPSTSAAPSSSAAADDDTPPRAQVGQPATNQGVTLTVTNAFVTDTIELNETNYAPGSGYEEYTPTPPDAGGKYVVVQTHIVNNAQTSMDLTCGYPIATSIVDTQERYFDTIDALYKLRGNPECNDQLQPGFEADMTYVFMVPANAQVDAFGFADATDFSNPPTRLTGVQLNL